jgi:glycosyltransferase involved in cell wall biosynthesis
MNKPADILFIHNNFPGQFRQLSKWLIEQPHYRVFAIGSDTATALPGVKLQRYTCSGDGLEQIHPYARRFEMECRRAEQVIYAANILKLSGMSPKVIFVHPGWGEALPLRQIFPDARICVYCEFYYRTAGADVGFDPELGQFGIDGLTRIALRNATTLLSLAEADICIAPTHWQRSQFPQEFQSKIRVIHDGVDVDALRPENAKFSHAKLPSPLKTGDEVLTFVARNLEPYRGFHVFMRALPAILKARPQARVCIVGGTGVSYGAPPPAGGTWKKALLNEIGQNADLSRVHFLEALPYQQYLTLLRVSRAHTYLTYPFVLSWSLLEALALECLVVASDTAPVREVIKHGHNGILVPFFDTTALADRLIDALASPEKYRNVRREARLTVTRDYSFKHSSLPAFREILGRDERDNVGDYGRAARRSREPVRAIPALRGTRHALQTT